MPLIFPGPFAVALLLALAEPPTPFPPSAHWRPALFTKDRGPKGRSAAHAQQMRREGNIDAARLAHGAQSMARPCP